MHLINRLPTPTLNNKSPLEVPFNRLPSYQDLRIFGFACYPYLRPYNRHKFDFKPAQCVFLGYSANHKGYLCLSSHGKVYVTRHVKFDESCFPFKMNPKFHIASSSTASVSPASNPLLYLLYPQLTLLFLHLYMSLLLLFLRLLFLNLSHLFQLRSYSHRLRLLLPLMHLQMCLLIILW